VRADEQEKVSAWREAAAAQGRGRAEPGRAQRARSPAVSPRDEQHIKKLILRNCGEGPPPRLSRFLTIPTRDFTTEKKTNS
jgi:hypothetical protein